jgi:hypothetical protein
VNERGLILDNKTILDISVKNQVNHMNIQCMYNLIVRLKAYEKGSFDNDPEIKKSYASLAAGIKKGMGEKKYREMIEKDVDINDIAKEVLKNDTNNN